MNKKIQDLNNIILNGIYQSELPVGVIYYILKDIFNDVARLYNETLMKENQQQQTEKEEVIQNDCN